jgi:outer membrane lipoprotein-sorting protein
MRLTCLFLLLFSVSAPQLLRAQPFMPAKDAAALQKKIIEASTKIATIQCDFAQEKNMSMLSDKAISRGKFYFKKDSKVRLEYLVPVKNLIVMNSGKMLMKDDKKIQQMDMHRSKVFQQLNNIIVGSINGSLFNGKDFTVSLSESSNQVRVELKPLSKMLKNFLSTIVLVMDKKDFTATKIEMNEASGDNTILSFSSKQINATVDDALFIVK